MKLHLPLSLLHAVLCAVCSFTFGTATLVGGVMALTAPYAQAASFNESNHHVEATSALSGGVVNSTTTSPLTLEGFTSVQMKNNQIVSSSEVRGCVVYHKGGSSSSALTLSVKDNGTVCFSDNSTVSKSSVYGGVIYCNVYAVLDFADNGDIQFANNSIEGEGTYVEGGVLYCSGRNNVYFSNNGNISFLNNHVIGHADAEHTEGGALYLVRHLADAEKFLISGNKSVTFSDNSAEGQANDVFGGAISNSKIFEVIGNKGDITFSRNFVTNTGELRDSYAFGGAVYTTTDITISGNKGDICVVGNKATAISDAKGGAFYIAGTSTFVCSDNVNITFSDNSVSSRKNAQGGALCVCQGKGIDFLDNSGKLTFSGNKAVSEGDDAQGGAIYSYGDGSPIFSVRLTDGISFTDNKAISNTKTACGGALYSERRWVYSFTGIGNAEFYRNSTEGDKALGGAVYIHNSSGGSGSLSMDLSGNIIFSGNKATSQSESSAGALRTDGDVFLTLKGANILFSDNMASADSGDAQGGAQSSYGSVDMQATNAISYTGNTAVSKDGSAWGGAAVMDNDIHQRPGNLTAGERISFSNNHAIGSQKAQGGALFVRQELTLGETKNITFSDNTAECNFGEAWGGAIHMRWVYPFTMKLTESVLFENNAVLVESGNAYGGAISVDNASTGSAGFLIYDNGVVNFVGNHAESKTGAAYGGAIYAQKRVDIVGNSNVTFRKNYVKQGATYKLSDLYSTLAPNLAAAEGGEIRFNGAVEVLKDVVLNQDYTGADSQTHAATGSIVFSGRYTEADLKEIKGGIAGTADEIRQSRTSSINGMLTLNNGRLLVEEHALLTATRMTAKAGTTVAIDNASLVSSSTSTSASTNTLTDCALVLTNGGALTFGGGLTLSGKVTLDVSGYAAGTYTLLSAYSLKGADLLDISYNAGKNEIYDITWNEKQNALLLTVTRLGRTEPETHIWSEPSGVLGNDLPLGDDEFRPGDSLQFNTATTVDIRGEVKPADIVVKNTSGTVEFSTTDSGSISGSSSLTKSGAGSLTVNTANTYSGGTSISGGTVTAGNAEAFGSGEITLSGGTLAMGSQAVTNDVTATGGTLTGTAYHGDLTVKGNVTIGSGFTAGSVDLESGTLKGNVKTGDVHTLYADGGQISGSLTLNGGSIVFGDSPLAVSGALTISSVTALDLSSYSGAGQYTLISAGSVSGDLSNLSYDSTVGRNSYSVITNGNALVLNVEILAATLEWNTPKGIWKTNAVFGASSFQDGDLVRFLSPSNVVVSGLVKPGEVLVNSASAVKFTADTKTPGSGIGGTGSLTKSGAGVLTLNAGNSYSGGTELNAGTIKATAADSFGTGAITVKGGTLDLASKAVANDIVLSGTATLKGDAKYTGDVTVEGKATLLAKTSYKGTTTIGEDSSLTLGAAATMAGNVALEGGTLTINNAKGMTLAKNQTMMLDGGEVRGLVTVGAGGTLAWQEGTMQNAPVLKGGTLDLGGKNALTLTGVKAQVQFGDKVIDLPGKGIVRSDETLNVLSGTVKLTMGKETTDAAITVSGNAALVNGATHSGDITVDGTLAKGTTIKLIDSHQTVNMNGAGTTAAAISGIGTVNVNLNAGESLDATAAKLTAANINLNGGTFTNTKGIKLAKGQTLTLNGASVNLGAKGILTTAAGSTLKVSESATLSGSLTLGGGDLVFEGAALTVKGTLTLSKPVSVTGSGTLICDSDKPFKGDLGTLFGGADVKLDGTTLTINGGATKKSLVAAPVAEEEASLDAAPALPTLPEMPATNPVADAIAQSDWGILDANRAFTGAVNTRHQHAALLDKGRGAAWVSAFGASVRHGNQGAHHGSDGNIEGAALGMEHSVSETGVLGLAVGRSKNRIGATGVTHLRQETAHVALYGQKQFKHNLTADATAAWGDTETKLGGSSWQQKSAALSGRLTHAHMVNDATAVRTFGGLCYEATESGSFGAGERSGSVQNLRAELGAGATHSAGKAHFYGEASLTGDLIRHNPSVEMDGLRHHGATPGRLGVKGTFGAFYSFSDTWTGTASYSVEAESRTTSHTLNVGVSKQF